MEEEKERERREAMMNDKRRVGMMNDKRGGGRGVIRRWDRVDILISATLQLVIKPLVSEHCMYIA